MTSTFRPYLPGVLHLIAELIGTDLAVELAKARGGRMVYVPARPKESHELARIVGIEGAKILSQQLGKGRVLIPCGNIGGAAGRRARIEALLADKLSHSEIAAEVDVHVRTVERVASEMSGSAQLDMFKTGPDTCQD